MKKSYQVLKWTAEVREKELQCLEEVELLDTFDASMCSVCQTTQEYETKYCPECGAKMDGDNNVK